MKESIVTGMTVLGALVIGIAVANLGLAFAPFQASIGNLVIRVVILGMSLVIGVAIVLKIEEVVTAQ